MKNRVVLAGMLVGSLVHASADLDLYMAIEAGDVTAAREALGQGANVNLAIDGKTPLSASLDQVTDLFSQEGLTATLKLFGKALKRTATTRAAVPFAGSTLLMASAVLDNSQFLWSLIKGGVGFAGTWFQLEASVDRAIAERAAIVELIALHPQQPKDQLEQAHQKLLGNRLVGSPKRAAKAVELLENILQRALAAR